MKVEKLEFYPNEKLVINGENYGNGITKVEITNRDKIIIYTYKNEENSVYDNLPTKDMHRVKELSKFDNIEIIVEE